jgi:two-component system sensor histidine kinase EvgS
MEKMLKRVIKEDIELNILLEDNLFNIKTDEGKIEQIIMNLASNASDAMQEGGTLTIKTKNVLIDEEAHNDKFVSIKSGSYVQLIVQDTGIGIDQKTLENIFDPFYTTKDVGKGTGLGLATVYGIVKQSQGYIFVESELEEGTTFIIFFPQSKERIEIKEVAPKEEKIEKAVETIMIVEDQTDVRQLIAQILKQNCYKILEAKDGEDALRKCKNHKKVIHLVITDVIMPNMNGLELKQTLTSIYPNIKVIFMSGYADNVIAEMGIMDIDKIFIEKPFLPSELLKKIKETLNTD